MSNAIDALKLITDRSSADVIYTEELASKIKQGGTAALSGPELAQWLGGMRGAYSLSDLNRVESAVQILKNELAAIGYSVTVNVKTNWLDADRPTPTEMTRYLNNINSLVAGFFVRPTTPSVPASMEKLDYVKANAIEQILTDIAAIIDGITHTVDLGWAMGIAHIGLWGGL